MSLWGRREGLLPYSQLASLCSLNIHEDKSNFRVKWFMSQKCESGYQMTSIAHFTFMQETQQPLLPMELPWQYERVCMVHGAKGHRLNFPFQYREIHRLKVCYATMSYPFEHLVEAYLIIAKHTLLLNASNIGQTTSYPFSARFIVNFENSITLSWT